MIVEWFTTWIATKAFGFLVKTIISEDFLKDLVKDYAKDFFKSILKNAVTAPFKREPLQKAEVMALAEFVQLMQQDLEYGGLSEDDIKKYTQPIKRFIKNPEVKEILGSAFKHEQTIDTNKLQQIWYQLNSSDDFNWKPIGNKYLQKVKEIILEVDELREIVNSHNLEKVAQNTTEVAGIIPQFDLEKYQEAICERYGNLKLDNLDTTGYAYNELKLWNIFIAQNVREANQVLPQVHELPKEHLRRLRESNQVEAEVKEEELERYKRVYLEQAIYSVLDIVNQKQTYKYIVILGDPGSGKSTLLQFLALNWANSPLDNIISLRIPLLIELRTYMRRREDRECHNFLEFFHKCSGAISHLNQQQLHEQLLAGKALVMFDGLDEVFDPGKREDVITDIHRFTNDYPNVQVIVTSRVIGYKAQRLRDAEFRHFILQDLEAEQIQEFIYRWHELTFNDEADKLRKLERLKRGIEASKSIAELAGNPLLLTMMAILNRNQELPRDRAELYNQASRVLLHQWDVERALIEDKRLDPKTIDYKDKQAMLRQVAYYMQTSEKGLAGNLISASDLEKILTDYLKTIEFDKPREAAKVMINQLRTRNFMLCFVGADYYAFVHRTFLEYFCAWEFVWQFEKTRSLTIEELKTEVFGKYNEDQTWHEVLQLIAGMIEPKFAGQIIDYLIDEYGEGDYLMNIQLALNCFLQINNPYAITLVENKLIEFIKDLINIEFIRDFLQFEDEDVIDSIHTQAISWITTNWKTHPETLLWLKKLIYDCTVRLESLCSYIDEDYFYDMEVEKIKTIQVRALQELTRGWKDDPDTLPMLKMLLSSSDNFVQVTAIQELARGWKDDPDTLPMLKALALSNDKNINKTVVIEELARGWKDDPYILSILKTCSESENRGLFKDSLRDTLMQELIQGWQPNPEIYDFIYDCANDNSFQPFNLNDDYNARQVALKAIIEQYPDHPQTLPLLRDKAENDPDEQVREFAQNKLKELGGAK